VGTETARNNEETIDVNDTELIAALEANDRQDMADRIKSEQLAKQLADSGRDDLAAQLTGTPTTDDGAPDEAAALEQLRAAAKGNSVSLPSLLDE
jgi:hypothetical protein